MGMPSWMPPSASRVRRFPWLLTTVFGLIPLIFDVFFGAMAVTIIVGLLFASALTSSLSGPLRHFLQGAARKACMKHLAMVS
jgi:hypothetical protein